MRLEDPTSLLGTISKFGNDHLFTKRLKTHIIYFILVIKNFFDLNKDEKKRIIRRIVRRIVT